ncbi:phospholipase A2 [Nocardioides nanhaiensis]
MTPSPRRLLAVTAATAALLAATWAPGAVASAPTPDVGTTAAAPQQTVAVSPATVERRAYTRTQRTTRANALLNTTQATFQAAKNRTKTGIDATFNWSDDGCSAPAGGAGYSDRFRNACERHDFGYRNMGWGYYTSKNLALSSTSATKDRIDSIFLADMRRTCGTSSGCLSAAQVFYAAVRKAGQAQTSFYKGECQPGYLCLFDDDNYQDRRVRLTASEDDMKDISFGDKTSSVRNTSGVAWRIYDDAGYSDRSVCVVRNGFSTNLDEFDFGDKTSSARRYTGSGCP